MNKKKPIRLYKERVYFEDGTSLPVEIYKNQLEKKTGAKKSNSFRGSKVTSDSKNDEGKGEDEEKKGDTFVPPF